MTRFLGPRHLEALHAGGHIKMADYVATVESAFAEQGRDAIGVVPRAVIAADATQRTTRTRSLKISAAYLRDSRWIGASVYTAHFRPGEVDLWFTLFSGDTGRMLGVLCGQHLSLWKTAATAAVATARLARPDARRVALIGTGRYAFCQLLGLATVRTIDTVQCFSRDPIRLAAFVARAAELLPSATVRAAESVRDAVRDADVVTTITTARTPILEGAWLAPGAHCNVLGAHDPTEREVDSALVRRGRVFVDATGQAFGEKGELLIPIAAGELARTAVAGELGAVVAGRLAGRRSSDEITVFLSGGTAFEYAGLCALLIERAARAGIGQVLEVD